VNKYFTLREIEGISRKWRDVSKRWVKCYLDFVHWKVDEDKTLEYCKQLKQRMSVATYRKRVYQILRFLTYLDVRWVNNIKPPPEPYYQPSRVTEDNILQALQYFDGHKFYKQVKALLLLGSTSGLRAEELYQLEPHNIHLDTCMVDVVHDDVNGKTTKTKKSRISFFNMETQHVLSEYFTYFSNNGNLKKIFSQRHISRIFRDAPIQVKDLRKFFSQEWDRRGGPTSIKKILMGHSIRNDVDLMHYNRQSEEDLKKIYDKVMS